MKPVSPEPGGWTHMTSGPPPKRSRFHGDALWAPMGIAFAVAVGLGCKKAEPSPEPVRASEPASAIEPTAPAAPRAPGEMKSRFEEESFVLAMKPVGKYEAGKPGRVDVVLTARGGYKCNDKYPYKFKAKASDGIDYEADVVREKAMKLEEKRGVMKVGFTPKSAGKKTVKGQFAFSVCTEERCLVEKRDLALKIDVE